MSIPIWIKMHNPQGHQVQFFYDNNGYLCQMIDSAGRKLKVATNHQGHISQAPLRGEGVLSLWIDYYDEERYNVVRTDKDSQPSEYHYSGIIILHFGIKC